jgi:hypothetical protein
MSEVFGLIKRHTFIENNVSEKNAYQAKIKLMQAIYKTVDTVNSGNFKDAIDLLLQAKSTLESAGFSMIRHKEYEIAPSSFGEVPYLLFKELPRVYRSSGYLNPHINHQGEIHIPIYIFSPVKFDFQEVVDHEFTSAEIETSKALVEQLNFWVLIEEIIHAAQLLSAYSTAEPFLSNFFKSSKTNQLKAIRFKDPRGSITIIESMLEADIYAFYVETFGHLVPEVMYGFHSVRSVVDENYLDD